MSNSGAKASTGGAISVVTSAGIDRTHANAQHANVTMGRRSGARYKTGILLHRVPTTKWGLVCIPLAVLSGCGQPVAGPDASNSRRAWPCPIGWVELTGGGCGPAVIVCRAPSPPRSCTGVELRQPAEPVVPGETPSGFHLRGDDEIAVGVPPFERAGAPGEIVCPPGWRPSAQRTCDPNLRVDCPPGTAPLPGGTCTRTAECSDEPWPRVPPGVSVSQRLHVRPGADRSVADGSSDRPFPQIRQALDLARDNTWILLSAGTYEESVEVASSVHIIGLCARRTIIRSPTTTTSLVIATRGSGVRIVLESLSVDASNAAIYTGAGSSVQVQSCRIASLRRNGITTRGAGSGVEILDSIVERPAQTQTGGYLLAAESGASIEISRVSVRGADGGLGINASGSWLGIRDSVVERMALDLVFVGDSAAGGVRIDRAVLRGGYAGIEVYSQHAPVVATDIVIQDTDNGVDVLTGALMQLRRVTIQRSAFAPVLVEGGTVDADELVALETRNRSPQDPELGVLVVPPGRLHVRRCRIENGRVAAVLAAYMDAPVPDATAEIALRDCVLRRSLPQRDGRFGNGVAAHAPARISLQHVLVQDVSQSGIALVNYDSTVSLDDVIITGVAPDAFGLGGGIAAYAGARVLGRRAAIVNVAGAAIAAAPLITALGEEERSSVVLSEVYVADVRSSTVRLAAEPGGPRPTGRVVSYGVHAGSGCTADLVRAVFDRGGYGFFAAAGSISLRQLVVSGQLDAFGATDGDTQRTTILVEDDVRLGNSREDIVVDTTLPSASALPSPTAVCLRNCM